MAKIAILGAGIMATALTTPLTDNGHTVALVGTHLDEEIVTSIQTTGIHPNLDLKVPAGVTAYSTVDGTHFGLPFDNGTAITALRTDVLKDGASAIYGADAMAGVVNLVTRTDYEGLGLSVRSR